MDSNGFSVRFLRSSQLTCRLLIPYLSEVFFPRPLLHSVFLRLRDIKGIRAVTVEGWRTATTSRTLYTCWSYTPSFSSTKALGKKNRKEKVTQSESTDSKAAMYSVWLPYRRTAVVCSHGCSPTAAVHLSTISCVTSVLSLFTERNNRDLIK